MIDFDERGVAWVSFDLQVKPASVGRTAIRLRLDSWLALTKSCTTLEELRTATVQFNPKGSLARAAKA